MHHFDKIWTGNILVKTLKFTENRQIFVNHRRLDWWPTDSTLDTVVVEGSHGGAGVVLVHDPVRVGRNPLLGRRVELVSPRVIFVGGPELDRMFLLHTLLDKNVALNIFEE